METTTTAHPLRTITLRYDRSKTAPTFETLALQYYQEIHDRTWEILQRIQQARKLVPGFRYQVEELGELLNQATHKFDHLKRMIPTNPLRDTVRGQLKALLSGIEGFMDQLVPELVNATKEFHNYDDYILQQEQWMEDIAFPQFHEIFTNYQDCSVDMVLFDLDLDDFRGALAFVKKQEGRYYAEMNALIDDYSDLNDHIGRLFEQVEESDRELLDEV